ncbi:hypothetical protein MPTK1_5g10810 [Marchantia polymorpha subsp. ruderalis]|uniref:Uncharacterized protein n=4 Tax=Marchantia polymorpha TaxID=3197 RepID=A0AAF6BH25_MARPO|nr:hypothetical protein MARPO_0093s0002 [Marchantia polymorpha]BBN11309.1 hypothetical protein Mp_5g10810 [Marchantia polymorpha subsp. ruderalis]|eukprot:PTQ32915.1 hypothetical protein MARPO_0093s0002 [Marchantia polymorpha]
MSRVNLSTGLMVGHGSEQDTEIPAEACTASPLIDADPLFLEHARSCHIMLVSRQLLS